MAGFVFAQYGNDRRYHFTRPEFAAANFVYRNAPANSLLVEGSRDYPSQFENYANFTNVSIDLETPAGRARIVRHPVNILDDWMSNPQYAAAYLIITRSQKVETDATGDLPRGSLSAIQRKLENSPRFQVLYRNRQAEIFALANDVREPQDTGIRTGATP
jgi:hypothetical protein